ncbi:MAG: hypothetical protein R2778_02075 [Saprospiraceae bacterium]|nr:hypothetical protein [Saprospiraceae bacterium]MCB9344097.1 hypothetical protein [Lewinellaceae bacterium]
MKYINIFLLILLAVGQFGCKHVGASRPVKYVAYLGFKFDGTGEKGGNFSDSIYISALNMYLDRINEREAAQAYPVEFQLKKYQCNYQEDTIVKLYQSIASDTNILMVVDNTWGRHIRHAAPIIANQLPVISISADQNRLDFGKNAVFLQPNDPQPNYFVQFIDKVLKTKSVGFVTECDYLLHNLFLESLEANRISFDSVCLWQRSYIQNRIVPEDSVAVMEKHLQRMLSKPEPSVILFNTHAGYGDAIMDFIAKADIPAKTFVGISTGMKEQELEAITREKGHTFIKYARNEEALSEEVYRDKKHLYEIFPRSLENGTTQQERAIDNNLSLCYDAMNIFETALRENCTNRASMVKYFQSLANRKITFDNNLYEFDNLVIQRKDPNFDQIHGGKTRSCPTQINTYGEPIANLRVGLDIIDINDIDVRKNTFDCNLLYWVIADSQYISKEGYIDFSNISSEEANRYMIAEEQDSNYVVRIYRISGKFLGNFKSFKFPFDHHECKIPIAALSSSNKIRISFDHSRLQINDKIKDFEFNDWDTKEYYVTLDNQLTNALGSPDKVTYDPNDKARYLENYKSLNVHLGVNRQPWGAIILIILPFIMFSALPLFMLFYQKSSFEEVGELIITSFLATVAYSINLVQISPATDSMNLAYIFLMMTLGINFFCFIYVTIVDRRRSASISEDGSPKRRTSLLKVWMPVILLMVFLWLLYMLFG